MNIRVAPWVYRLLWITVAVIGAICSLGFLPLLFDNPDVTIKSDKTMLMVGGLFGAAILAYALWRLLWPLKPQK